MGEGKMAWYMLVGIIIILFGGFLWFKVLSSPTALVLADKSLSDIKIGEAFLLLLVLALVNRSGK